MRARFLRRSSQRRVAVRRWVRRTALLVLVSFALMLSTQDAVAEGATLPAPALPSASAVASWFTSPHWGKVPEQESGSAAGRGHLVSSASTRAGRGAGHAIGKGKGELPEAVPYARTFKVGASASRSGFNPKTSRRIGAKSSATSTYFQNADGTITQRLSQAPVNYRDGSGNWQPIDTKLARGPDGRYRESANSDGLAIAAASSTVAGSPLATFTVPGSQALSWSLQGVGAVSARVSGSTATFPGVLADTDLSISATTTGAKESIVLRSAKAANSWTFPLQLHGLKPRLTANGAVDLFDSRGTVREQIPAAYAYDSKVDPRSGDSATTHAVSYRLRTLADGSPALVVTLNRAWLKDRARVFPVTVDPTFDDGWTTTYAESSNSGDHSTEQTIKVGSYDSGTHKANSFINHWYTSFDGSGVTVTGASLHLFDTWASTCTAEQFDVAPITGSWTPTSVTSYPGPSYGASIGSLTPSVPDACANTAANRSVGDWVSVPLSTATLQGWANGTTADHGLAVYAPTTDALHWKQFGSFNDPGYQPYLEVTYTGNVAPQIYQQYPQNNAVAQTTTPELSAVAGDDATASGSLQYDFQIYNTAGAKVVDSGLVTGGDWTVPAGKLTWGQTYYWTVQAYDGTLYSAAPAWEALSVQVPQPVITSSLTQNTDQHGFDASIGNYTTEDTDASVSTAGPSLDVVRDYNSRDPRWTGAFGAGWSSVFDARAAEQYSASGAVTGVVVTYPDGSEVGFGKNADGTFSPPSGRFATLSSVTGGGYTLTDKNDTVYTFGQSLGSGAYGITAVTDADARAVNFAWTSGHVTAMTSAVSGRALHLTWTTPSGASAAHVTAVATDPVNASDNTTVLTWTYNYTGDQLATVCSPTDQTHCTAYGYTSGSQYQNAALDLDPHSLWSFSEGSGTTANSAVIANEGSDAATYSNVTLGQAGPLAGSSATAAGFNGTSSTVLLPKSLSNATDSESVSMWFKTSTKGGVLLSYNSQPLDQSSLSGDYTPSMYVGSDGKLNAEFWYTGGVAPIVSATSVADGNWHHVVLAAAGSSQTLYLDGAKVGTASGQISFGGGVNTLNQAFTYVGGGYIGGGWPDEANYSTTSNAGKPQYFNGTIADVGVYSKPLVQADISALYSTGTHPASLLSSVTRPSGKAYAAVSYDPVSTAVTQVTDENGGTWKLAAPTVAGSSQVYRSSVLGTAPQGYWRLGDTAGASQAGDEINSGTGTYSNVTLGVSGPFADNSAASFNGTSSYLQLPQELASATAASAELWFKTSKAGGVLLEAQSAPLATGTTGTVRTTQLWVGTDGKLYGGFWTSGGSVQLASGHVVTDNAWHHAVLSATGSSQYLYLDGSQVASKTGTSSLSLAGAGYVYVGAGTTGEGWSGLPNDTNEYFSGSIAEVALYDSALSAQDAADHYTAARNSAGLTPLTTVKVTDPANATWTYQYDPANGNRIVSETDGLGGKTSYGYDSGGFEHTVTDPDGDMTATGHDVRGNTVSVTSCQNQAANACSTQYFSYYPDDTTAQLTTPDARNDLLLTSRDGRSASASDPTYETSYAYDTAGNQTGETTPPVPGFPSGRTTATVYSDGTSAYPAADSGNTPKGLPVKTTTPSGSVSTTAYLHNGDVASTTDASGLVTKYTYDNLGRVLTKTEVSDSYPNGLTTSYTYDGMGQVTKETSPAVTDRATGAVHTAVATTAYDYDGDVTSQTVADASGGDASRTTSATYNSYDQVASRTDANGNAGATNGATTTYQYDAAGNLQQETDQQGTVTQYTWDDNGHLLTQGIQYTGDPTNPSPATLLTESSHAYDPAGRLASVTDAMGNTTKYTYTDDGLEATITKYDKNGQNPFVLQNDSYDAAGNLTKRIENNGATETDYQVDAVSRTTTTTVDPTGADRVTSVSYTPDDLVASTNEHDGSGSDRTTTYGYDTAGNRTSQTLYGDASGHPTGWWKLDQSSGNTVTDASGTGNTAAATGTTWDTTNKAAVFPGTTGQQIATNGPVLNTTTSYTISAWVNLSTLPTGNQTVVAEDGTTNSPFYLQYNYAHTKAPLWAFNHTSADTASPTFTGAYSSGAATSGSWTHLVGVYNVATGAMQLYVNGALAGSATDTAPWAASGSLTVGRGKYNGGPSDLLAGSVSNVQVYPRALSATEVSTLYGNGRTGGTVGSSNAQTTSWTYDQRGLPTSETDPNTQTTHYTYDEAGNLAVSTAPASSVETGDGSAAVTETPVTTTGYNTFGEPVEEIDPNGNETTMVYDANGNRVSQTDPSYTPPGSTTPLTQPTVWTYDSAGNKTAEQQPDGETTKYTYDQLGNLVQTVTPSGATTHTSYDYNGDPLQVVDATGATTQATYDSLGRKLTASTLERYPTAKTLTTTYSYAASATNPGGAQLASTTTPDGVTTGNGYDHLGELTSTTDGAGNVTQYAYDFAGNRTRTTNPDQTWTQTDYNASDLPTAVKQYDQSGTLLTETDKTYDGDGNVLSTEDANRHSTTFTYDPSGDVTQEVQPVDASTSITTSFGYDAAGNRTRFTDGRQNSWYYTYNPWGLLASSRAPATASYTSAADSTTTYAYNGDGQLTSMVQPGGVTLTMGYDQDGNLNQQSGTGAEAATATRSFSYDGTGRLTGAATTETGTKGQAGYQAATSENFTYDDRGDLLTANGSAGNSSFGYTGDGLMASRTDAAGTSNYTYDNADRLHTASDAATGTTATYTYNSLSQPSTIQYGTGGQTRTFGYDALHRLTSDVLKQGSTTLASLSYGYDNNGNLTSKTTTGVAGAGTNTYTYDWADRLFTWNNGTTTTQYGYDASGNRTRVGSNVYTYDARDELTSDGVHSYSYTARGTMLQDSGGPSGTLNYTTDAYGQQITAGAQSYGLDALGRTVTDTTNAGTQNTTTANLTFSGTDNLVTSDGSYTYAYGPDGTLLGINTLGAPTSSGVLALTDQHDDVVGDFTTGATALAGSATYDPLGNVTSNSALQGRLGFQSGWTDPGTGKVDMSARWYDPANGQFLNKDTATVDPAPNEAAANPFSYVADNPLDATDPSGHCSWWDGSCEVQAVTHAATHAWHSAVHAVKHLYHRARRLIRRVVAAAKRTIHYAIHRVVDVYRASVRYYHRAYNWASRHVRRYYRAAVHYLSTAYHHLARAVRHVAHAIGHFVRRAVAVGKRLAHSFVHVVKHAARVVGHALSVAARTAATYLKHHAAAIASFVVSTAVFAGCEAVTEGVGTVGCAAAAGAAGGLVEQGFACAQKGGSACSVASFGESALEGAASGAAGGAAGELVGAALGKIAPKAIEAVGGLFGKSTQEAEDIAASDLSDSVTSCAIRHSFTGSTRVLMADGSTKAISQIKVGDKIADAVPGAKGTESHTVTRVIVTRTDHDFVQLTIRNLDQAEKKQPTLRSRIARKAALGLAASAAGLTALLGTGHGGSPTPLPDAAPAAATSTLTTTYHHPFYDKTQNAFVDADHLHEGDLLQTPTGTAQLTAAHLFHANTTTYDLTIGDLHTYYVEAGDTPVLVHNCNGGSADLAHLTDRADDLHSLIPSGGQRFRTTGVLHADGFSGGIDLSAVGARSNLTLIQRADSLESGELALSMSNGAHAEVKLVTAAQNLGLRPGGIAVSRPFCAECSRFLEDQGAKLVSPRTALWLPPGVE